MASKIEGVSISGQQSCAAFRGLVAQGIFKVLRPMPAYSTYTKQWLVGLVDPWEAIAKRLAAQQVCDKTIREADASAWNAAYSALQATIYAFRGLIHDDQVTTATVLAAWDAFTKARTLTQQEDAKLTAEKARLAALPPPTPEEALTWLVARQLKAKSQ